jgi:hypothetical protein
MAALDKAALDKAAPGRGGGGRGELMWAFCRQAERHVNAPGRAETRPAAARTPGVCWTRAGRAHGGSR